MNDRTYMDTNRAHWDEITPIHVASEFYDVEGFRRNPNRLKSVELEELGDVRGKTLLHLQCHFGLDTLSWANQGAVVTGMDFSAPAIEHARTLAAELNIDARFIQSNVYDLPDVLDGQFDIVFTSYGAVTWLPDLSRWAKVAAHFVRPGGFFYVAEFHPMAQVLDETATDVRLRYPYFPTKEPQRFEDPGTYADLTADVKNRATYNFPYPLANVVTAIAEAGLRIDFLHEFPFMSYRMVPYMREDAQREWRLAEGDGCLPLTFSVKATKVA
jgi:2-polyprenyl-3-methyl-5-hydroxy-6-metoxy-1,4-benzoquinol methylase